MPALDPWNIAGLGLFAALVIAAMVSDLRHLRIPNSVCLALLAALVIVRLVSGQPAALGWGLLAGAAALAAGFVLYATGVWGGGDAKLLAVVVAWVGLDGVGRLLLVTAAAGGAVAGVMLLVRRWRPVGAVPYGLAIGIGGLDWALSQISMNF